MTLRLGKRSSRHATNNQTHPTIEESKDFYYGNKSIEEFVKTWMQGSEHKNRIKRYFHDMFGMFPYPFISISEFDLIKSNPTNSGAMQAPADLNEDGVYHLRTTVKPNCGTIIRNVSAWWSDETIDICSNSYSDSLNYGTGKICTTYDGIFSSECGCGPLQIACYPLESKGMVKRSVVYENRNRFLFGYENKLSWNETIGGSQFIGNRWLFHYYLYQGKISGSATEPSDAEIALLKSLPAPISIESLPMKKIINPPDSPERSGVLTSPAFLKRFNNFRSRVRAPL